MQHNAAELKQVADWMTLMGQHVPRAFVDANNKTAELRFTLIEEEYHEWERADPMSTDLLDALLDLKYVTYGTIAGLGLALDPDYQTYNIELTNKKIRIDHYVAMVFAALRKRPLCSDALTPALSQLVYALDHAGYCNGFDMAAGFDIVHQANLNKFWTLEEAKQLKIKPDLASYKPSINKYVVLHDNGKVRKPPSFQPPDLQPILIAALRRFERPTSAGVAPAASAKSSAPAPDPAPAPPAPKPALVALPQSHNKKAARPKPA